MQEDAVVQFFVKDGYNLVHEFRLEKVISGPQKGSRRGCWIERSTHEPTWEPLGTEFVRQITISDKNHARSLEWPLSRVEFSNKPESRQCITYHIWSNTP